MKRNSQRYGIYYDEIFAHVVHFESIRILIVLAAQECWSLHHMVVKSILLNDKINEEIYVT